MNINSRKIMLLLAEKKMKQNQLASLSGISKSNLSLMLNRGNCTPRNAGKIAFGLGVPVEEIIAQEGGERIVTRNTGPDPGRANSTESS